MLLPQVDFVYVRDHHVRFIENRVEVRLKHLMIYIL
jgi:hypothetical protein